VRELRTALIYLGVASFSSLVLPKYGTATTVQKPPNVQPEKNGPSHVAGQTVKKDGPSAASSQPVKSADYDPATYVIGADDQLLISVWHEPELSMSVTVRPDGIVTLPLLNDVHAAGLKPLELQALLIERLKPFVNEPQVTVSVQTIRSRRVFVAGQGAKPGAYPLTGRMTVLELLVQAGGLGPFAKAKSIYVLRKSNGQETRIRFNYKDALSGKTNSDIVLEPGDIVVIP
jgi:polysaccharide export outer membrane protein